jgi:hypothetical protein
VSLQQDLKIAIFVGDSVLPAHAYFFCTSVYSWENDFCYGQLGYVFHCDLPYQGLSILLAMCPLLVQVPW